MVVSFFNFSAKVWSSEIQTFTWLSKILSQALAVQRTDNFIQQINRYLADKM